MTWLSRGAQGRRRASPGRQRAAPRRRLLYLLLRRTTRSRTSPFPSLALSQSARSCYNRRMNLMNPKEKQKIELDLICHFLSVSTFSCRRGETSFLIKFNNVSPDENIHRAQRAFLMGPNKLITL